ncbi:BTB/POZ domain-containing protein KCTD9-like [Lytechinus variegatus]|uniref:BTB/POZ domain-containing protein KCTD9-like n=1 Tax=Lytechinus variegatus TaxID=7654 RepID=UPI001BB12B6A|nr:BTB/POZ domain-containing protein KCTD9-like [Lytechinus variegatus]
MASNTRPRVTIFRNGRTSDGKVIACPDTMERLILVASNCLGLTATHVFTAKGGRIEDASLIRDDEILYISENEPFIDPKFSRSGQSTVMMCSHEKANGVLQNDWITLNVGGRHFMTNRRTLVGRDSESMLARMFADDDLPWSSSVDHTGAYLIDRSPVYFEPILNYLRHGQLIMDDGLNPSGVLEEAKFFGIQSLIKPLEEMVQNKEPPGDHTPMKRWEFIRMLQCAPSKYDLRCQGMNFEGADLSKLDLKYINFTMSNLSSANLSGANLSYCTLERANLSAAKLDGANLRGVKMVLANLENASLRGCNFEDPAGTKANMEGVNMKGVNLENSQMAGVNLRVATLKNANLQNSNLRWAILAGTDLENCNLTGCDLQDANLRGANVKNATFEEMLTPLHMSQSVAGNYPSR